MRKYWFFQVNLQNYSKLRDNFCEKIFLTVPPKITTHNIPESKYTDSQQSITKWNDRRASSRTEPHVVLCESRSTRCRTQRARAHRVLGRSRPGRMSQRLSKLCGGHFDIHKLFGGSSTFLFLCTRLSEIWEMLPGLGASPEWDTIKENKILLGRVQLCSLCLWTNDVFPRGKITVFEIVGAWRRAKWRSS